MPLTTNLVAYWKFDESSGNAADSTADANTLTNNNTVTYSTGLINNGAYLVKASKEYFSILEVGETGLDLTGDCSFNIWVYLQTAVGGSEEYPVVWKYNVALNKSYGFRVQNNNTIQFVCTSDGTTDTSASVAWTPSTGTWYMMTVVYTASAGSVAFYINASQQGTTQTGLATSIFSGTSPFLVGQRLIPSDPTTNWDGRLDELGVWSRTLSGAEITSLYNGGAGNQYPFSSSPTSFSSLTNFLLMGI